MIDTVHAMDVSGVVDQHRVFSTESLRIVQYKRDLLRTDFVAFQMAMIVVNVLNPII